MENDFSVKYDHMIHMARVKRLKPKFCCNYRDTNYIIFRYDECTDSDV